MESSHEESLRALLARVHERLGQAATVDPETRRLLVALTHDIERTLGSLPPGRRASSARGAAPPADAARRSQVRRESLSSLEGLAARFDADHPALAQTVRDLADLLGKVGI